MFHSSVGMLNPVGKCSRQLLVSPEHPQIQPLEWYFSLQNRCFQRPQRPLSYLSSGHNDVHSHVALHGAKVVKKMWEMYWSLGIVVYDTEKKNYSIQMVFINHLISGVYQTTLSGDENQRRELEDLRTWGTLLSDQTQMGQVEVAFLLLQVFQDTSWWCWNRKDLFGGQSLSNVHFHPLPGSFPNKSL